MDLITVTRNDELEFKVRVRDHSVTSDMSEADGGHDAGPSPAEMLAASLGACTAMMAQRYCERHGWDGDASVSLTLELADNPKRVGRIVLDLELPEKAKHLRVMITELGRIASHLVAMGAYGLDLGSFTPFLYAFRKLLRTDRGSSLARERRTRTA